MKGLLMPLFGPPNVEKLEASKDTRALIKALGHETDANVRLAAAKALSWYVPDRQHADDYLRVEQSLVGSALHDADERVRAMAIKSLVTMLQVKHLAPDVAAELIRMGPAAGAPLIEALEDHYLQTEAAMALGKIGGPVVEPLIANLRRFSVNDVDPDDVVRHGTDLYLQTCLAFGATGTIAALVNVGSVTVDALIAELKNPNPQVRLTVATALGKIGGARAAEPLILLLLDGNNQSPQSRIAVAAALGQIGDARAVEALADLLQDGNMGEQVTATAALVKIGAACGTIEPLVEALQGQAAEMRMAAARELGLKGDPRARAPLLAALKNARWSEERKVIVGVLDSLGWQPRNDTQRILRLIARQDWAELRKVEAQSLDASLAPALANLLHASDKVTPEAYEIATLLLPRIGAAAVEPLMQVFVENDDIARLRFMSDALVGIGEPAVNALIARLRVEHDVNRRQMLVEALRQLRDPRAIEPLMQVFVENDDLARLRFFADALVRIGEPAVDALTARLRVEHDSNRKQVLAEALMQIGDKRAIEPLIEAFKDKDWRVRKAEVTALAQIADVQSLLLALKAANEIKGFGNDLLCILRNSIVQFSSDAVEPLLTALDSWRGDPSQLSHAWEQYEFWRALPGSLLAEMKEERAVKPLVAILRQSGGYGIVYDVGDDLAEIGGSLATELLTDILTDEQTSWAAKATAVYVLAKIGGNTRAVEPLVLLHSIPLFRERGSVRALSTALHQVLSTKMSGVPIEQLNTIAHLQDITVQSWDVGHAAAETISFSGVRTLARQELLQRSLEA
jgi:HEAT repeat protein